MTSTTAEVTTQPEPAAPEFTIPTAPYAVVAADVVTGSDAVRVRTDVPAAEWDRYVDAHPDGTAYHLSGWPELITRAFGHRAVRLTAEERGTIAGVLPLVLFKHPVFGRFVVSVPFMNRGGVLASSPAAAAALLREAIRVCGTIDAQHLELRHSARVFPHLPCRTHKVAMLLPLADTTERQWQLVDRKVRNQVRKAEKSGVVAFRGGLELLPAFYRVFARNMRDLGTPVYSIRFFEEVLRTFPDTTRVFCCWYNDQPVAASIVCWHRDAIEVPWASSIRDFNSLCPNMLLYWHMLRFSTERRFRVFDFGRSTPHERTYEFKRQWGAQPDPLVWEYWLPEGRALPDFSPKNPKYSRAIEIWQKLPVGVTTLFGPSIVRNIP